MTASGQDHRATDDSIVLSLLQDAAYEVNTNVKLGFQTKYCSYAFNFKYRLKNLLRKIYGVTGFKLRPPIVAIIIEYKI